MSSSGRSQAEELTLFKENITQFFTPYAGEGVVVFELTTPDPDLVSVAIDGPGRPTINAVSDILYLIFNNFVFTPKPADTERIRPDVLQFWEKDISIMNEIIQKNQPFCDSLVSTFYVLYTKKYEVILWLDESLKFIKSSLRHNPDLAGGYAGLKKSLLEKFAAIDIVSKTVDTVRAEVREIYNTIPAEIPNAIAAGKSAAEQEEKLPKLDKPNKKTRSIPVTVFFDPDNERSVKEITDEKSVDEKYQDRYQQVSDEFLREDKALITDKGMSFKDYLQRCEKILELAKTAKENAPNEDEELWQERITRYQALIGYHQPSKPGQSV